MFSTSPFPPFNMWITVKIINSSGHTWKKDADVYEYLLSSRDVRRQLIKEGQFDREKEYHPFYIDHKLLPVPILMQCCQDDEDLREIVEKRLAIARKE
jgi:hypothetical protein